MSSGKDSADRPIVVVTGMGVVTSLGAGKADNWAKLTAGKSGIRAHHALRHRRAEDPHRRHRRFRADRALLRRRAGRASRRDWRPRRRLPKPASAARRFPGTAVPRGRAGRDRMAAARRARAEHRGANDTISYDDLLRAARPGAFAPYHDALQFGSVADHLAEHFGTKGSPISLSTACASGATRDPARRRGDPARRNRRGAVHRHRRLGQPGIADPLLAAVGAVDLRTIRPRAPRSRSPRTATASSWPKARRAGAGKPANPPRRAARRFSACSRAAARWRIPSTAPAPARTASRSSAASATRSPTPASRPTTSTTSIAHGTGTPENDKMECLGVSSVFGERSQDVADLVQQIDDRPHAVGGRRGRGGVHAADAAEPAHSADHQLQSAGSDDPARRGAERGARRQGPPRDFQFVRLRRTERRAGDGSAKPA